jgi:hypothetical protein
MADSFMPATGQESQGFEALVQPHLECLYRLAYRLCGSRPDAEDLVQSLLVKLYPQTSRLYELDQPDSAPDLENRHGDRIQPSGRLACARRCRNVTTDGISTTARALPVRRQ